MPVVASVTSLVGALRTHRLLDPPQLEQVARWSGRFPEPRALAKELIQRGWLTPYQVNQVLQSKGHELVMGQYILLERLGEGGMGQVFKARHEAMGRVVALKVLRKELLAKPEALKRFLREIRLVGTLSHPNIVIAFDAAEINGVHFLAMEYVEGIDLGRLVKLKGPVSVADACSYIRQAALGLQHAYEKGLVHRDIKPTNLLRANQGGVVKVLDLGLARLQDAEGDDSSSGSIEMPVERSVNMLTHAGKVMGTPDFIAPEQARNSHTVDIRADLYSLGCTFFYILTGFPPYGGKTYLEKLVQHQEAPIPQLERIRPEVPLTVANVVRQLMAKLPEQRFQTPGMLANTLASLGSAKVSAGVPLSELEARQTARISRAAMNAALADIPVAVAVDDHAQWAGLNRDAPRRRRRRPWAKLGCLVLVLALIGLAVGPLRRYTPLTHFLGTKGQTEATAPVRPGK
jgi:serine/threonine protein kinase